jgi:4-amino-4-deoxy-L-arabinose transferase-like glycosyltransferase
MQRFWNWYTDLEEISRTRVALGVLLLSAFILRLAAVLILPSDFLLQGDAEAVVSRARNLIDLGVLGEHGYPTAQAPPGYPLFIAAVFVLTNQSLFAVRFAQAILGALAVWPIYLLGQRVASKKVGYVGAFIFAVYPVWIIWPIRSLQTCTRKTAVVSGIILGITLLTREVLLFFPLLLPLILIVARIPWRCAWRYTILFALAALIVLSPWLIRNYYAFGHVFYTERTDALRYRITGSGYVSQQYEQRMESSKESEVFLKSSEFHEHFGTSSDMRNLALLASHPGTYFRYLVNRLAELWFHPVGLESLPEHILVRTAYVVGYAILIVVTGLGVGVGLKRRNLVTGILLLLLVSNTVLNVFFVNPLPRYNLPFTPIIFILAAAGALWLGERMLFKRDVLQ